MRRTESYLRLGHSLSMKIIRGPSGSQFLIALATSSSNGPSYNVLTLYRIGQHAVKADDSQCTPSKRLPRGVNCCIIALNKSFSVRVISSFGSVMSYFSSMGCIFIVSWPVVCLVRQALPGAGSASCFNWTIHLLQVWPYRSAYWTRGLQNAGADLSVEIFFVSGL